MRKQTQIIVMPSKEDKTAYQQAREEGKSPFEFVKMTLIMLASISALVMIGSKFDKLMHDPLWGMIGTGVIIFVAVKLFSEFDKKW